MTSSRELSIATIYGVFVGIGLMSPPIGPALVLISALALLALKFARRNKTT